MGVLNALFEHWHSAFMKLAPACKLPKKYANLRNKCFMQFKGENAFCENDKRKQKIVKKFIILVLSIHQTKTDVH